MHKNTRSHFFLLAVFWLHFTPQLDAQHFIRRVWQADFGAPVLTDWSSSLRTADDKLVTVGNTLSTNGQTAMLTTVQDDSGNILWSETFLYPNSSASHSYGICLAVDPSGNVYVAGAGQESLTSDFDMALVKYDSTGQELWSVLLGEAGDDAPSAIALVEGDTLLFLTGASSASNDTMDYLTFQLSANSGDVIWEERYDYADLEDVPVALETDAQGNAVVTGGSASEPGNWDIATLKYGKASGSLLAVRREGLEFSLDHPAGLAKDVQGNYYIGGNMRPVGQPFFIRVLKLDEDLELVWETDFWGDSLGCKIRALHLDEENRPWIGGSIVDPSGRLSPLIARLDSSDGAISELRRWNFSDKPQAEIRHLARAAGGGMYALGQAGLEGPGQVFLTRLDSLCNPFWEHQLPGEAVASGLQRADSLEVVAAIALYGPDSIRYKTIRYEESNPGGLPVYNEDGDPLYLSNRVIVRFNPGIINLNFADEPDEEFTTLSNAVTSEALIPLIDTILGVQGTSAGWKVYKIFPYLHSGVQTIPSRLGHEIPMPKLWSALLLEVDEAQVSDPPEVSDSLMQLPYEYIRYAHPSILGEYSNIPNDPLLGEQFHLWDTTSAGIYTDAHIRMDSVWEKYTWDTSRVVHAGVFDSGVRFTHEDFQCDSLCPPGTLNGTVVHLNKDFYVNASGDYDITVGELLDLEEDGGHGTNVAGLLGAIGNNGIGVSGVAGGDFGAGVTGVLIQNYRVTDSVNIDASALSSAIGWAIVQGGVDVMNSSFGFTTQSSQWQNNQNILREVYGLAFRANVVAVNSRGNAPNDSENIPATLRDEWGISVGASGTDGHIATEGENVGSQQTGDVPFSSKYGMEMDVMAPGAAPQLRKTISFVSDTSYQKFSATSASSPQVMGLAAWVLNQTTYPLAVEDVERLIEYAASDKNTENEEPYFELPGYDERSGWGLIHAGATLDLLHDSKIIRARVLGANKEQVTDAENFQCSFNLGCPMDLLWPDPDAQVSPGNHNARIWKYSATFSIDVCQEWGVSFQTFPDPAKYPFWALNSLSPFFGPTIPDLLEDSTFSGTLELKPWEDSRFHEITWDSCTLSGSLVGYKYEFLVIDSLEVIDSTTIPLTADEDFFFSILVKADTSSLPDTILLENLVLSVQEANKKASQKLSLWPNPFNDQLFVQFREPAGHGGLLQVFDFHGRLTFQKEIFPIGGVVQASIPTVAWPPGAYFIRFLSPAGFLATKAIKL